jgi:L-threonylcarbamoyladenylate synthase
LEYKTEVLPVTDPEALKKAAEFIRNGELVAIPTETVYGLAANAADTTAVSRIFTVKGRPQDNPLIVHIASVDDIPDIAREIPDFAKTLFEKYSPGPLTIVLPKSQIIPDVTSGGLDTVGVRIPDIAAVRELIKLAGCPLAAPSANLSGKPSPTTARHVFDDLNGKIPLILDGGICAVGLESTVISVSEDVINILRPGKITVEDLSAYTDVKISNGVLESLSGTQKPESPGQKYKHYAPKADITVIDGDINAFLRFFNENADDDTYALMFDGDPDGIINSNRRINYGKDPTEQMSKLFAVLRDLDERGVKKVFARCPEKDGTGLAVYNRLIRAAGFRIINLQ